MTLSHQIRDPEVPEGGSTLSLPAALRRALEAAHEEHGRRGPWRFYPLAPDSAAALAWLAARSLEPAVGHEGARAAYEQWRAVPGWVVVTCLRAQGEPEAEHNRIAARTAAQRASLSLWSDNIPANWVPDLVPDEAAFFELIGASDAHEVPVGVLLYGHPDRASDIWGS